MLNRDELEMLVTGANISGYMEEKGMIAVGDDTELTSFLLEQIDVFEADANGEPWWDRPPWHDFIDCKLREQYGAKKGD